MQRCASIPLLVMARISEGLSDEFAQTLKHGSDRQHTLRRRVFNGTAIEASWICRAETGCEVIRISLGDQLGISVSGDQTGLILLSQRSGRIQFRQRVAGDDLDSRDDVFAADAHKRVTADRVELFIPNLEVVGFLNIDVE